MFTHIAKLFGTKPSPRPRRATLGVEGLEGRAVPAAVAAALTPLGILAVGGTDGADRISVAQVGTGVKVLSGTTAVGTYPAASVKAVVVAAGSGNDVVDLAPLGFAVAAPSLVNGGAGDDVINGGRGTDILFGGAGNDILIGGAGNDLLFGQDGSDYLSGGAGDDWLGGGAGADYLYGDAGRNVLCDTATGNVRSGGLAFNKQLEQVTAADVSLIRSVFAAQSVYSSPVSGGYSLFAPGTIAGDLQAVLAQQYQAAVNRTGPSGGGNPAAQFGIDLANQQFSQLSQSFNPSSLTTSTYGQ